MNTKINGRILKIRAEDYLKFSARAANDNIRTEIEERLAALDSGKVLMIEVSAGWIEWSTMDKA